MVHTLITEKAMLKEVAEIDALDIALEMKLTLKVILLLNKEKPGWTYESIKQDFIKHKGKIETQNNDSTKRT